MASHSHKYVMITIILVFSINIVLWVYNNDHIPIHPISQSVSPDTSTNSINSKQKLEQYLGSSGSIYKGKVMRKYPHDRIQFRGRHIQQPLKSRNNIFNLKYPNWAVFTIIFKSTSLRITCIFLRNMNVLRTLSTLTVITTVLLLNPNVVYPFTPTYRFSSTRHNEWKSPLLTGCWV